MKLRNFYKIDHTKKPIPGSNIRRKSKPQGHQWKELPNFCCVSVIPACSCGDRYFVQVDKDGNPIDGTLIKRTHAIGKPHPVRGIHYAELNWECCVDQFVELEVGLWSSENNRVPGPNQNYPCNGADNISIRVCGYHNPRVGSHGWYMVGVWTGLPCGDWQAMVDYINLHKFEYETQVYATVIPPELYAIFPIVFVPDPDGDPNVGTLHTTGKPPETPSDCIVEIGIAGVYENNPLWD